MTGPRPDWRTVIRHDLRLRPYALAATADACRCGATVEPGDPIVAAGAVVDQAPDGRTVVDLSGCEWVCDRHGTAPAAAEVPA